MSPQTLSLPPRPRSIRVPTRLDEAVSRFMRPGVVIVVEDTTLQEAERAMISHGVHSVLVVGREHADPIGWVTARGLLAHLESDPTLPCARAVTEPVTYVAPSATAKQAAQLLSQADVTHLLVSRVPGQTPVGVVSDFDLVALVAR
jgi:CBS domain-containing protein